MLRMVSVLLGAALIAISLNVPVQAEEVHGKSISRPGSKMKLSDFIADAKNRIATCNGNYQQYLVLSDAHELMMQTALKLQDSQRDNGEAITPLPKEMDKFDCENEKVEFIPVAKSFIKAQKNANTKRAIKDMVAQWMTVIDSFGNSNLAAENSKFETMANGLLLEL
jgi:hypothetical protein